MLKLIRKLAACAILLGTASQSYAQATPIASGHLKGGPTIVTPVPSIVDLTFTLVELPDGSVLGSGKLTNQSLGSWILFDLTSYIFVGDGILMMAGTVTKQHTTVIPPKFQVGNTVFFAIKDKGNGGGVDEFIDGLVPPAFGPVTIQQIFAVSGVPPPEIFRKGISGNITFH